MFGAGGEVAVRRGQLILRALSPIPALYRGVPLHPDDDPSVFWIDLPQFGIGPAKVVSAATPQRGRPRATSISFRCRSRGNPPRRTRGTGRPVRSLRSAWPSP
jgi:hypothetical protein